MANQLAGVVAGRPPEFIEMVQVGARHKSGSALLVVLGVIRAMRFTFIFIVLSLLVVGCGRRDAKIREKICGSWGDTITYMTFLPDGNWHGRNGSGFSNGTWDVKDGLLIFSITNTTSKNTNEGPRVGTVERVKITFIDAHDLQGTNENGVFACHR